MCSTPRSAKGRLPCGRPALRRRKASQCVCERSATKAAKHDLPFPGPIASADGAKRPVPTCSLRERLASLPDLGAPCRCKCPALLGRGRGLRPGTNIRGWTRAPAVFIHALWPVAMDAQLVRCAVDPVKPGLGIPRALEETPRLRRDGARCAAEHEARGHDPEQGSQPPHRSTPSADPSWRNSLLLLLLLLLLPLLLLLVLLLPLLRLHFAAAAAAAAIAAAAAAAVTSPAAAGAAAAVGVVTSCPVACGR